MVKEWEVTQLGIADQSHLRCVACSHRIYPDFKPVMTISDAEKRGETTGTGGATYKSLGYSPEKIAELKAETRRQQIERERERRRQANLIKYGQADVGPGAAQKFAARGAI